ncbi:MAG: ribonucleoside triphosphate reductase [Candidatus Bathyarchaeota archaeon]|nr:ribonucleoside triphosphate reductase [Candidatus Bathyarchaeota archaeon]
MAYVRKRNGQLAKFDQERITEAIWKAFKAVGGKERYIAQGLSDQTVEKIHERVGLDGVPTVEEVQDIVENTLIKNGHAKMSKAYILYRQQHKEMREMAALLSSDDLVEQYLDRADWRVKENSNMSYSLQGLNNYLSSSVISNYWLNRIYPPNIGEAHRSGAFHIHDLAVLGPYCVGWDLPDLLLSGFKGVPGKVESAPAKHLRTALGQVVNFFYTLQGEAAGAQAFSNFDTYLAPFIRYDGIEEQELKQIMQEFLFNINVPTRVGFQTPFTNITLDINVPKFLKNEPVIIGGKIQDAAYGDFEKEMALFNSSFANVLSEGDASGRVFTFPIPTYNVTEDFEWESPVAEQIFKMTAKYGIPYFSNFINTDMNPEDVRSMCCRLRIDNRELRKRGGGFFGSNPLTGSIGVVTMNMPQIGYEQPSEDKFMERLAELMDMAKDSLVIKRKVVERFTEKMLYPYSRYYLRRVKEAFDSYWANHFSTIGLVGMNEACLNLMDTSIASPEGLSFAERVMNFMRERLSDYQEETGHIFNLEASPAEGTSYRLAQIDKLKYPNITVANESYMSGGAEPFYTNSTHLPVDYTDDVFEALVHQNKLQPLYTGGTVLHTFLGEQAPSWKAASDLVRKIAENSSVPYFTLTPTFSVCQSHGYLRGNHPKCPECNSPAEVYSRVVGYLRPVDQWNDGKRSEWRMRETYDRGVSLVEAHQD